MPRLLTIGPEAQSRCLVILKRARVTPNEIGPVGTGKSSITGQFAEACGVPILVANLSLWEPSDLVGIGVPKGDCTQWLRPRGLPFVGNEEFFAEKGILFWDEADRCEANLQNACLSGVLDGRIGEHTLMPGWWQVLAMNGSTDIYTTPLSEAMRTRVCHLYIWHETNGPLEQYAEKQGWHQRVRDYLANGGRIKDEEPEWDDLGKVTPRGLEFVQRIETALEETTEFPTGDLYAPLIQGVLGFAGMIGYLSSSRERLPTPREIGNNPTGTALPSAQMSRISVVARLVQSVKPDTPPAALRPYAEYILRFGTEAGQWEITSFGMRTLGARAPAVYGLDLYTQYRIGQKQEDA